MPDAKQCILYGVSFNVVEKQTNSPMVIQTHCLLCIKWHRKDMKAILGGIRNELLLDWGCSYMLSLKFTILHILF